jgi:hypothetical protein
MQTLVRQLRGLLGGLLAGGLGGALVGVAESALVTWTSAANDEYWLVLFGAIAYGAIGAASAPRAALRGQLCAAGAPRRCPGAGRVPSPACDAGHFAVRPLSDQPNAGSTEGLSSRRASAPWPYGAIFVLAVLAALVACGRASARTRARRRRPGACARRVLVAAPWGFGTLAADAPARRRSRGHATRRPTASERDLVIVDTLRSDASRTAASQPGGLQDAPRRRRRVRARVRAGVMGRVRRSPRSSRRNTRPCTAPSTRWTSCPTTRTPSPRC